jgi:hypothetical protein
MQFTPPPYLDPGAGSFLIQLLIGACTFCGTPAAAIVAIIAFFRYRGKKSKEQTSSTNES